LNKKMAEALNFSDKSMELLDDNDFTLIDEAQFEHLVENIRQNTTDGNGDGFEFQDELFDLSDLNQDIFDQSLVASEEIQVDEEEEDDQLDTVGTSC
jgi:hypothetical protein